MCASVYVISNHEFGHKMAGSKRACFVGTYVDMSRRSYESQQNMTAINCSGGCAWVVIDVSTVVERLRILPRSSKFNIFILKL